MEATTTNKTAQQKPKKNVTTATAKPERKWANRLEEWHEAFANSGMVIVDMKAVLK